MNVLRHVQGNYISALDTLPDTIMIRILTCYLCISPKLPKSVAMPIANSHFFVYPPERGEIGILAKISSFSLKNLFRQVAAYQMMFYFVIALRQSYQTT